MNAYIYQAALLCEDCAEATLADMRAAGADTTGEDSDRVPQGPYSAGGGEADTPQHCDHCHKFLENPLTDDGREYVQDAMDNHPRMRSSEWREFYGIEPQS